MKISEINRDYIKFDNGKLIEYYHRQDCCEDNYADFEAIDDLAKDVDFNENLDFEEDLDFEECEYGFRFGNKPNNMFFVPCYSEQKNGYYTMDINIIYNKKEVIKNLICKWK